MNVQRTQQAQRTQLIDEATEWHLRLQAEEVSDDTITRWVQWCESHPDKQHAFDEVREFWQLTQGLESEVRGGEFTDVAGQPHQTRRPWLRRSMAAGLAAAAIATLLWMSWTPEQKLLVAQDETYRTRLSDDSRVELAARSTVLVDYAGRDRNLELKNGEAYFTVAPDKERPFVVTVGDVRVYALGTSFNLRRAGSRTVVTVTEGLVEVVRTAGEGAVRKRARGGEQITLLDSDPAPRLAGGMANTAVAWRDGRLEYVAEPLESVIADLNRYTQRPAVVADDAAKALRFSGTVLTGNTAEWIAALPGILPLTVQNENGVDVIRSAH